MKVMLNLHSEEDVDRTLNIDQLLQSVKSYEHLNEDASLIDYLESVTLQNSLEEEDDNLPSVSISTVHASKGLEFDYVFIIGLEEGKFPLARAMDSPDELEEERRLMYVAITRARKKLYLTRAKSRFMYGSREKQMASRFVNEAGIVVQKPIQTRSYDAFDSDYDSYSNYNGFSSRGYGNNYGNSYSKNTHTSSISSSYSSYDDYAKKLNSYDDKKISSGGGLGNLQNLMNNKRKVTSKQIVALIGVFLLVLLYIITLIVAVTDTSASGRWFMMCLFATIAVPLLIWIYTWMYGKMTGRHTIADSDAELISAAPETDGASAAQSSPGIAETDARPTPGTTEATTPTHSE